MHILIAPLRWWIRLLRTRRESVSLIHKLSLSLLMLPAFVLLWIMLRIAAKIGGPIEVEARTVTGIRFKCRLPDLIQLYVWLFDVWEPDLTKFTQRRLATGDTFVDVGSHTGYYSVLAAKRVGESGRVVAIEASPEIFQQLQETMKMNGCAGTVRAINKAAAASTGAIDLYVGPSHNVGLTTTLRSRKLPKANSVPALPLDDMLTSDEARHARMIKIDVEGAEDGVLAGMNRLLREGRRDLEIVVELSPAWWTDKAKTPTDVLQPLFEYGFHAYELGNNYWPWRYLWPNCVTRPKRIDRELNKRVARLDLVLSRLDVPEL